MYISHIYNDGSKCLRDSNWLILIFQAYAFFFFAGLMFLDMLIMALMTRKYEYKNKANQILKD